MSSFAGDIASLIPKTDTTKINTSNVKAGSTDLGMADFLQIMVAQFQNQDPDNAADTSDMLNQLMQMTVIQAVNDVTDAATMLYTSSLVGKEVTIGEYDRNGKLQEIVGTVTATGTYGGKPVVFIGDDSYYVSSVMAVGRLPDLKKTEEAASNKETEAAGSVTVPGDGDGDGDIDNVNGADGAEDAGDAGNNPGDSESGSEP